MIAFLPAVAQAARSVGMPSAVPAALLVGGLISGPCPAQTTDPRVLAMPSGSSQPIALAIVPGRDLSVLLPAGERVDSVVVGDTESLHVSVPDSQDGLVVSALHAVPGTIITVHAGIHTYTFNISASPTANAPWLVSLGGGSSALRTQKPWVPPTFAPPGIYRVSGSQALRPKAIRDDGTHTYIEWPATTPLPAVFGIGSTGSEEMVDGYMRAGAYVIDRTYPALVFRMDKAEASARREIVKAKR